MARWSACPGSVNLSAGLPNRASKYAAEGTAAHELAALAIRSGTDAAAHLGRSFWVEDLEFVVDESMAEAVQVYLDAVRAAWVAQEPGVLIVFDYKHGSGVPVQVERNLQLIYYGFGALYTAASKERRMLVEHHFDLSMLRPDLGGTCDAIIHPGGVVKRVRLVVVQPRCYHADGPVRSWEFDAVDMVDWRADLLDSAKRTDAADAPLVAGDHCKFCPAAAVCPELERKTNAVVLAEFTPLAPKYDVEKLATLLNMIPQLETRIEAARKFAYAELTAGRKIPGYKLVDKRPTRKWVDEKAAAQVLMNTFHDRAPTEFYTAPELKSPAQVEAVIGKSKSAREALAGLVEKVSSGTTMVPESDSRPAVAGLLEMFDSLSTESDQVCE
jgi:hypothetical protein